jgi:hypothetical protein
MSEGRFNDTDSLSEQGSYALRGLVAELRASNDEKQKRVTEMHTELADLRSRYKEEGTPPRRFQVRPEQAWHSPQETKSAEAFGVPISYGPSDEKILEWDQAIWNLLEEEEAAWEDDKVSPYIDLQIDDSASQTCEIRLVQLLDLYREVIRRMQNDRANARMQVINDVASRSHEETMNYLAKELEAAWTDWRERELNAEQELATVNAEVNDLMRRVASLEVEERESTEQVARLRSIQMVPQHEVAMLNVELSNVRNGLKQKEAEFNARRVEDEAKVHSSQEQLELLNRELGLLRQRNLAEETRAREKQTKLSEVSRQKAHSLEKYRRTVMPLIEEYNTLRANESELISTRSRELLEMSSRHRQELLQIAR